MYRGWKISYNRKVQKGCFVARQGDEEVSANSRVGIERAIDKRLAQVRK